MRHRNGFWASTVMHLREMGNIHFPNVHARVILGIGPLFLEQIDDDVTTYEDILCVGCDVDSNSKTEDVDQW